ncbi:DUF2306 domain-containing protein [Kangiella shandongensis]|uniref:hypothetical protein n=1 Tax=Kangiella shandongensis TaxID=2763258 RepID=UPI001CC0C322|nr:hypothetical protein [Kangiella shandongensis]
MELSVVSLIHFSSGVIAILSGFLAMFARKGKIVHRRSGTVFVVTMLIMAGAGVWLAVERNVMISLLVGVLTSYFVLTAWLSVGQRITQYRWFSHALSLIALGVAIAAVYYGVEAKNSADGKFDGFSSAPYFAFAGVAGFALLLDLLMMKNGGVKGKHKTARHLWRMSFPLYIATTSFFEGPGVIVFPESIQGSWILSIPGLLVIIMMIVGLVAVFVPKVRFGNLKREGV